MQTQNLTIDKNKPTTTSNSMQACIDNCTSCYQLCAHMITYCLEKGGLHAKSKHIQLLQDCAKICEVSANFMIRESHFHNLTCGACAKICIACAESCEAFSDDDMMKSCAEICRKCAKSCEEMAKMQ